MIKSLKITEEAHNKLLILKAKMKHDNFSETIEYLIEAEKQIKGEKK